MTEPELRQKLVDIIKGQSASLTYEAMFPEAQEQVDALVALLHQVEVEALQKFKSDNIDTPNNQLFMKLNAAIKQLQSNGMEGADGDFD